MLQEQKSSAGFEHPPDLSDRLPGIPNAAQRPGAQHAIEPPVLEGQFLGGLDVKIYVDAATLNPTAGDACHPQPWIHCRETTDVFRVMLQVQPRPEADLMDEEA